MSNPFADATDLVGDLKIEYTQLNQDIPKLEATKASITGDIEDLNKTYVKIQDESEKLKERIKLQTEAYNNWQMDEYRKLETAKADLKSEKDAWLQEYSIKELSLHEKEQFVEKQLTDSKEVLANAQAIKDDAGAQIKVNNTWAENLKQQEAALTDRTAEVDVRESKVKAKEFELEQREAKIPEGEQLAIETVKKADQDRGMAKQILANAKDKIAANDAREQSLDMREKSLNTKDVNLRKREAALTDRINVMTSNGTLS